MLVDMKMPDPVDRYVGERVRLRRKLMSMSQEELAALIGLTFQQVQKYERGSNRISASKLFQIATALKTRVAYFFDGYPTDDDGVEPAPDVALETLVRDLLGTSHGLELARAFPRVRRERVRSHIADLVTALAED